MVSKIIITALVIYFILLLSISLFQRKLLYYPKVNNYSDGYKLNHEIKVVNINSENNLLGWYYKKDFNNKTILFLHGNAGTLENRIYKLNEFYNLNLNYLIFAYRGYNGNAGNPTELGIYYDANEAIKWLKSNGVEEKNIVIYGESLGTAVAIEVGQNKNFGGIILEAPFTSMVELGQKYYPIFPVKFVLKDKYESKNKIKNLKSPILVLHGRKDKIVPFYMGEKIFEMANNPKFKYFTDLDDHMMNFDDKLINEIDLFISNLN